MERCGYKVVTKDMKSLGLRRNPNILTYPENGELYRLPPDWIQKGIRDWGGIWVVKTFSRARHLTRYMDEMYQKECRVFVTALGKILFENDYRIKTDSVEFLAEIILE